MKGRSGPAGHGQGVATSFGGGTVRYGYAALLLNKEAQTLTVHIRAEGLEPNQVHVQHIHGFPDDKASRSPTIRGDADRDGFVELERIAW